MKNLNLQEMLSGYPAKLRFVTRFSTVQKIHHESVAEHSYYVALYAMLIADWLKNNGSPQLEQARLCYGVAVSEADLYRKSLLHDLEESVTGDINRMFKYSSDKMQQAIHQGGRSAMLTLMGRLTCDDVAEPGLYLYEWERSKDTSIEGRIVAFCDFLSVLSYMLQELAVANDTMREHWTTMYEYIRIFDDENMDFLRPLVTEAEEILTNAFKRITV